MIKHEAKGMVVFVDGLSDLAIRIDDQSLAFDRAELTDLRYIIDQALNTSAEELEASE